MGDRARVLAPPEPFSGAQPQERSGPGVWPGWEPGGWEATPLNRKTIKTNAGGSLR
jgi:hypothetical protein